MLRKKRPLRRNEKQEKSQEITRFTLKQFKGRLVWVAVGLIIAAMVIAGRLFLLQVVLKDELIQRNESQVQTDRKLQSPRGTIYDRNGNPLAVSVVTKSLYADPKMINKTPEEIANLIAPYVRIKKEQIIENLKEDTAFVWMDRMMDGDKSDAVQQIIEENNIEGVRFLEESRRFYPNSALLAQTLGFVGIDDKGLDGLEMVLDDTIRGGESRIIVDMDRNGTPIFDSVTKQFLPDKEKSVTLTIDTTIQFIAERALDKAMVDNKPVGASIIIMDPKTGEILAMANRPSYDPNVYNMSSESAFKNRAVTDLYEPGSTFKPIIAAAALSSGKWKTDTVFHDTGAVIASGHAIKNWNDEGYGDVKLLDILKYSINTGMARIGLTVGPTILMDYVEKFGFGKKTGIELPGEGDGILFKADEMSDIDTASMSIGQAIAVTPLQMVRAFGAIANGGHMMTPHIIKSINKPDGSVVKSVQPTEVGQPISPEIAATIVDILEKEVSEGGGNNAAVQGYRFGGKTGTAQKLDTERGGYLEGRYIASFIGFGPVEDAKFVALVVIDDPSGVYYGGQIAAPVFRDVMSQLVRYYQISPSTIKDFKGQKTERPALPGITRDAEGKIILPAFSGWTMGEVRNWLQDAKLEFKPDGTGYAISQTPVAGTSVDEGEAVIVNFTR